MNTKLIKRLADLRVELAKGRDEAAETMRGIVDTAAAESRDSSPEERSTFEAAEALHRGNTAQIVDIDARVTELVAQDEADLRAAEVIRKYETGFGAGMPQGGAKVTNEPEVYSRRGQRDDNGAPVSYFLDLNSAARGNSDAASRLQRNAKLTLDTRRKEGRAISTSTGAGGEFVPPLWLEDDFVAYLRPSRVIANKCELDALPAGTNQIHVPKVLSGTAVAQQGSDNTAIQQTDLTTGSISSPVITLAGGQTISMQLIEQSPLKIDAMVLKDLAADYGKQLSSALISAMITAGTAVTYTQAAPVFSGAGQFYNTFLNAVQKLQTTRFDEPTAVFMHPRRWAWVLTAADTANRPLVVPAAGAPQNAAGVQDLDPLAQGYVGQLGGYPVYVDPNIPTNAGAGTNQDSVFVSKIDDVMLWEGNVRAEAFQETYAQQLSLFVRLYNYVSIQAAKYPASIQVIGGTGLVPPTF